jgi:hypothetical protein
MQSRRSLIRGRRSPALVAAGLGLLSALTLLACSSSEPADPRVPPGRDDTYVFATMTLLDRGDPCVPPCDGEFIDCTSFEPQFPGESWELYGDIATAGVTLDTGSARNIAVAATDTTSLVGVAIEFRIGDLMDPNADISLRGLPTPGNPCANPSLDVNGVFVDLDGLCARISGTLVSESRFTFDTCEPWDIQLTSWETDAGGVLQQAVRTGGNQFSPAGIMEGTFSFVASNTQTTASGDIQAWVQVEGCFRVSVPGDEQGVPSNPNVASSLCTP